MTIVFNLNPSRVELGLGFVNFKIWTSLFWLSKLKLTNGLTEI